MASPSIAVAANQPPTITGIVPTSGGAPAGKTTFFTVSYQDPDGWQNIKYADLLVNTFVSGNNCCQVRYDQNANKLYLRNDANTAWLGGYAPGSWKVIENSFARLNCITTNVGGSQTTLIVRWAITFKAAFVGLKYTFPHVADDAGAETGWIRKGSWTIQPDATPPTGSVSINAGAAYTNTANVTTTIAASDAAGPVATMRLDLGSGWGAWEAYATSKAVTLADPDGDGLLAVKIEFRDTTGNTSKTYSDTIILDTLPPSTPTIFYTNTNICTDQAKIVMTLTTPSTDAGSGIAGYDYRITRDTPEGPVIRNWTPAVLVTDGGGTKITADGLSLERGVRYHFHLRVRDNAGNTGTAGVSSAIRFVKFPSVGTLTPVGLSSSPGDQVIFTATYYDRDAWQNLASADLLINVSAAAGYSSCSYAAYNQNTNTLSLRNDAGTGFAPGSGSAAPGSATILENSFVALDCARTTVTGSYTTMTVRWALTFKKRFTGVKKAYLYTRDDYGAGVGWVDKGSWTILDILSVSVNPKVWNIGPVAPNGSITMTAANCLTVTNDGTLPETFGISLVNPAGWVAGTAPSAERFALNGIFCAVTDRPSASVFNQDAPGGDDDNIGTASRKATGTVFGYAGAAASGVNIAADAARSLYLQFKAPTTTARRDEQDISVVVNCQVP